MKTTTPWQWITLSILLFSLQGFGHTPVPMKKIGVPADFDVSSAMTALFDNFNQTLGYSTYDVPQSTTVDLHGSSFERGDDVAVYPYWAASGVDNGKEKVFLLTYAVPIGENGRVGFEGDLPFECHACWVLVGAAVFVKTENEWHVESSRTAVTGGGGWGEPPAKAELVHVGPRRLGIEIIDENGGGGETTAEAKLVIPWGGKVNEALATPILEEAEGACGPNPNKEVQCAAYKRKLEFIPGKNPDYYDVLLSLRGFGEESERSRRPRRLRGSERLEFVGGVYEKLYRVGDIPTEERHSH
jgi:hypothetical protein